MFFDYNSLLIMIYQQIGAAYTEFRIRDPSVSAQSEWKVAGCGRCIPTSGGGLAPRWIFAVGANHDRLQVRHWRLSFTLPCVITLILFISQVNTSRPILSCIRCVWCNCQDRMAPLGRVWINVTGYDSGWEIEVSATALIL